MNEKNPPQKPANLRPYSCDLIINHQHLTKLEISPYYEKHNKEYLEKLKRKGIKLPEKELAEKLITDDLIRKILVPQLNGENDIRVDGRYYQYTYYFAILYKGVKAYKLVWCLSDNEPKGSSTINEYSYKLVWCLSDNEPHIFRSNGLFLNEEVWQGQNPITPPIHHST